MLFASIDLASQRHIRQKWLFQELVQSNWLEVGVLLIGLIELAQVNWTARDLFATIFLSALIVEGGRGNGDGI